MQGVIFTFSMAAIAFTMLFTGLVFHFWIQMALTVLSLCALAFRINPETFKTLWSPSPKEIHQAPVIGLLSAALLYCFFFTGGRISSWMFSNGAYWINNVYTLKIETSQILITLLLIFIIGPGEEIFWRGYLQKQLEDKFGFKGVIMAAGAYTIVHLPSGNPMLIAAAAVCGCFWGFMFRYFRSIWANVISHTAWDIAIFILWPVNL